MDISRRISLFIVAALVAITGCSCSGQRGEDGGKKSLVIGIQQEPEILNEAVSSMVSSIYVCNLIFSKFVKHNDRMELIPDLIREVPTVENGGISDDHLRYTYHLRENARWHDGKPVTSADIKFTVGLMKNPDINVGTRQGWDIIDRVETPDRHTVVFHLSEVYSNFAGDCFYDESVLPKHLLEDYAGRNFMNAPYHQKPVGSGPFILEKWEHGSHMVFVPNRDYYGDGPHLDRIVIKFILEDNALLFQLESGGIMGADNVPSGMLELLDNIDGIRQYRTPALFLEHLDLNCSRPPLDDPRVRRAISAAIDRELISEKIYGGLWIPAYSDEHPASPYHMDIGKEMNMYDPSRAGKLLGEAGWVDRDGDGIREKDGKKLVLTLSTTTGRANRERTEVVLVEQLGKVGFDVRIKNYHPSVMFAGYDDRGILTRGEYHMALYAFMAPPDPSTKETSYSADFIPPEGQNYSYYRNEELTRLLAAGSAAVSFEERKRLYRDIMNILAREMPVVPLLWITLVDAMPENLDNYRPNPTQSQDTWNAAQWRLEK